MDWVTVPPYPWGSSVIDFAARVIAALRLLPPEQAHRLTIWAVKWGLAPRQREPDDPILATRVFGLDFPNPIGLAAGFDKNAEVSNQMLAFGFGFVEVGSVTPKAQPGNPKPRLFRLQEDLALINRLGFNNQGLAAVEGRLAPRDPTLGIVGVNLGKNKESVDVIADYRAGVLALAPYADYLAINVSSPNTPGLRAFQGKEPLDALIDAVQATRTQAWRHDAPPILLKIAPDLSGNELCDIAEVALARKLDGLIIGNTTVTRPSQLKSINKNETGGLSGQPLYPIALGVLTQMYRQTQGQIPLVGVGGIASGMDAYKMIRAGASLVQLYTALVYSGPGLVARIKAELIALLRRDGFRNVAEAVGADFS